MIDFYRATLCVIKLGTCRPVSPSVRYIRVLYRNGLRYHHISFSVR